MPWWALVYVSLLVLTGALAAWSDWRERKAAWAVAELLSTSVAIIFVAAIWNSSLRSTLGVAVVPLFLGFLIWEAASAVHDFKAVDLDPELTPRENTVAERAGALLVFLLLLPAAAAGAVLSWQVL